MTAARDLYVYWLLAVRLSLARCTYIAEHFNHLFLFKQLKDPRTEIVEVRRKRS
jgi:hypothetical protein